MEADLGLYNYRARFYDPYLNRFVSPDPIIPDPANPQNLNKYTYVLNNLLRFIDPSGHCIPELNCPQDKIIINKADSFDTPVEPGVTSSGYKTSERPNHMGTDFGFRNGGNTRIQASAYGKPIASLSCDNCGLMGQYGASENFGLGNMYVVEYPAENLPLSAKAELGIIDGQSLYAAYAHLKFAPAELQPPIAIAPGDQIAVMGNTGNSPPIKNESGELLSDGTHLHWETQVGPSGMYGPNMSINDWNRNSQDLSIHPPGVREYSPAERKMMLDDYRLHY